MKHQDEEFLNNLTSQISFQVNMLLRAVTNQLFSRTIVSRNTVDLIPLTTNITVIQKKLQHCTREALSDGNAGKKDQIHHSLRNL